MLFFLSFLSLLAPTKQLPPRKVAFTIEVKNIRQLTGRLEIGIYQANNPFPDGPPITKKSILIDSPTMRATFQLEPGEYAVALYQDLNSNGQIDKKLFGIPKEPYGFSNNIRPRLATPRFDECKVSVRENGQTFISLID